MNQPVFELKNIDYQFDNKQVLENINIHINKGEFLAIVGPNGAGKSTLLKIILGLLPLQKGEIYIDGKSYKKQNQSALKISYVSQKATAFNAGFPASVKEVVLSGLTKTKKLFQKFYETLEKLKDEGITIILVTHDIGVVADTATKVACLNKHLHFHGSTEDFKKLDEVEISKIYGHPIKFVDHQHNRECCEV